MNSTRFQQRKWESGNLCLCACVCEQPHVCSQLPPVNNFSATFTAHGLYWCEKHRGDRDKHAFKHWSIHLFLLQSHKTITRHPPTLWNLEPFSKALEYQGAWHIQKYLWYILWIRNNWNDNKIYFSPSNRCRDWCAPQREAQSYIPIM